MTLFFETLQQSSSFLAAILLGMLIAAGLCFCSPGGMCRMILDLIVLLSGGIALILLTVLLRDMSVRLYHLLGIFCGSILYLCGIDALGKRMKKLLFQNILK